MRFGVIGLSRYCFAKASASAAVYFVRFVVCTHSALPRIPWCCGCANILDGDYESFPAAHLLPMLDGKSTGCKMVKKPLELPELHCPRSKIRHSSRIEWCRVFSRWRDSQDPGQLLIPYQKWLKEPCSQDCQIAIIRYRLL